MLSLPFHNDKKKFSTGQMYLKKQTRVTTNQYIFTSGLSKTFWYLFIYKYKSGVNINHFPHWGYFKKTPPLKFYWLNYLTSLTSFTLVTIEWFQMQCPEVLQKTTFLENVTKFCRISKTDSLFSRVFQQFFQNIYCIQYLGFIWIS